MRGHTVAEAPRRDLIGRLGPYISVVLLLFAWEGAVQTFNIPPYLMPGILDVARSFIDDSAILLDGFRMTLFEIVLSFSFSIIVGVALATMVLRWPLFNRAIFPLIVLGQSVPILAAAPLFIVWFGFGLVPKIVIATLVTFFPVLMGAILGIRSIDEGTMTMARSIGLSSWQRFVKIELPGAMPSLFGGLRIAVTLVLVGVVVGEFVGSSAGLGYIILRATGTMDTSLLFAALLSLIFIGLCMFGLLSLVERAAMPWRYGRVR